MKRRISILGASGSIGQNTLDLIRRRRDDFDVVALTGGRNVEQLARDAIEFQAKLAVTAFPECYQTLVDALAGSGIAVAAGADALIEAAGEPSDWIMSAIVGAAGLAPGLRALEQGTTVALANKESLVTAGPLFMGQAKAHGTKVLPVDSEHSAIFQALVGEDPSAVDRIIITASGGPFRNWPFDRMARATLEEALNHPNWKMGQRITIDSATMFNKAMEVIETKEFFGVPSDQIEVLVHPESLVHAIVSFRDGAMMAHLGSPDMRHAIGFALNWPMRESLPVAALDLARIGKLQFEAPDPGRFPALRLARDVMERGGLAGAAFTAAKEQALDAFLARQIGFLDMAQAVESVLDRIFGDTGLIDAPITLENVTAVDLITRRYTKECCTKAPQKIKA